MKTLCLWIFGLLLISPTGADGLNHFPNNFVSAKRNSEVILTCGTMTEENVTWMFENVEIDDYDEAVQKHGQNLTVVEVDTPMLGEYSCRSEGKMLSSTYLLLEEEGGELDSLIKCWAKSYNCNFSCTLENKGFTAVRLGLGHDCRVHGKSCEWVSSSIPLQDGGFQFKLSHSLSPYAEESTMFELTVEAITNLSILRRTKRFYLRDIVRPDSPQVVKCQEMGNSLNVTIEPPSTWSTPHSFFILEHEIEYELKDNGKIEKSSSPVIPKLINKLRVRSRDSVVFSSWSEWTPWRNVKTGPKTLCKCRNAEKYCCPEMPSGYFEQCKNKKSRNKNKMPKKADSQYK